MTALTITQPYKVNQIDVTIQSSGTQPNNVVCAWSGRTVRSVKDFCETVVSRSINAAQKVLNMAASLVSDPNALAGVFRRLNCQVINALEELKKIPSGSYLKLRAATHSYVGAVDAVQVFDDVNYFVSKKYKIDNNLTVASRAALFAADVGGTLLWLEELTFLKLNKIAKTLGEVRVFSFVPKVTASIPLTKHVPGLQNAAAALGKVRVFGGINRLSLGLIAGSALTLFYLFSTLESIRRLTQDGVDKKQAGLDLSYHLSELTLNALLTAGVASVVGLGALGATCLATGLASFAHRNYK